MVPIVLPISPSLIVPSGEQIRLVCCDLSHRCLSRPGWPPRRVTVFRLSVVKGWARSFKQGTNGWDSLQPTPTPHVCRSRSARALSQARFGLLLLQYLLLSLGRALFSSKDINRWFYLHFLFAFQADVITALSVNDLCMTHLGCIWNSERLAFISLC